MQRCGIWAVFFVLMIGRWSLAAAPYDLVIRNGRIVDGAARGRLSPGLWADVVVFDAKLVADRATLADPGRPSEGIRHVVVNGQLVLRNGHLTGLRPGRALRRNSP